MTVEDAGFASPPPPEESDAASEVAESSRAAKESGSALLPSRDSRREEATRFPRQLARPQRNHKALPAAAAALSIETKELDGQHGGANQGGPGTASELSLGL